MAIKHCRCSMAPLTRGRGRKAGPEVITSSEFRWMARYLRGKAELPRGVRIRWILDPNLAAQGFNGSCEDFDSADRFEIRIASQLSANHCWDCLAHELGHIRQRIFHPDEVDDHGDGFGVEFARLWRSVVGEG